jgi:hypothetical protein
MTLSERIMEGILKGFVVLTCMAFILTYRGDLLMALSWVWNNLYFPLG